ncbi:MAG: DUF2905 domain-containing protein [Nitriliruptoraceae bacterium]
MHRNLGLLLIAGGLVVAVVGVLVFSGALQWFGRLPGDIRIDGERTRVFVPVTSAIIASIVLTIVVNLVLRLFR